MAKDARSLVLGFIHVARVTDQSFRGGYLLTTDYGRPIEFIYTSELKVPKTQQALYGGGFEQALYAEILAKPMTDRQCKPPQLIAVDSKHLLELRKLIPAPVVWLEAEPVGEDDLIPSNFTPHAHPDFPKDRAVFDRIVGMVAGGFDWLEPFDRILAALAEIRDPAIRFAA